MPGTIIGFSNGSSAKASHASVFIAMFVCVQLSLLFTAKDVKLMLSFKVQLLAVRLLKALVDSQSRTWNIQYIGNRTNLKQGETF